LVASADRAGGASPAPVIAAGTARSSSLSPRPWYAGGLGTGGESCHLTAAVPALAHCWPSSRCSAADDAEDRNSGAEAAVQARIAAAAMTANRTAGCPNGSSGARRHGGSSSTPPAVRGGAGGPLGRPGPSRTPGAAPRPTTPGTGRLEAIDGAGGEEGGRATRTGSR